MPLLLHVPGARKETRITHLDIPHRVFSHFAAQHLFHCDEQAPWQTRKDPRRFGLPCLVPALFSICLKET